MTDSYVESAKREMAAYFVAVWAVAFALLLLATRDLGWGLLDDPLLTNGGLNATYYKNSGVDFSIWATAFDVITRLFGPHELVFRMISLGTYAFALALVFLLTLYVSESRPMAFIALGLGGVASSGPEVFLTIWKLETMTAIFVLLVAVVLVQTMVKNEPSQKHWLHIVEGAGLGFTGAAFGKSIVWTIVPSICLAAFAYRGLTSKSSGIWMRNKYVVLGSLVGIALVIFHRVAIGTGLPWQGSYTGDAFSFKPSRFRFGLGDYIFRNPDVMFACAVGFTLVVWTALNAKKLPKVPLLIFWFLAIYCMLYMGVLVLFWPPIHPYYTVAVALPASAMVVLGMDIAISYTWSARKTGRRFAVALIPMCVTALCLQFFWGGTLAFSRERLLRATLVTDDRLLATLVASHNDRLLINLPQGNEMIDNLEYLVAIARKNPTQPKVMSDVTATGDLAQLSCNDTFIALYSSDQHAFGFRESNLPPPLSQQQLDALLPPRGAAFVENSAGVSASYWIPGSSHGKLVSLFDLTSTSEDIGWKIYDVQCSSDHLRNSSARTIHAEAARSQSALVNLLKRRPGSESRRESVPKKRNTH